MNESDLDELLNAAEAEMRANEEAFFDFWNQSIRANLRCSDSFRIQDHVSRFGGFRLRSSEVELLVPALRDFFRARGHVDGDTVWLRGYAYYECDPQMHERRNGPTERALWNTFRRHWNGYSDPIVASEGEPWTSDVVNWIGMLSYLEYLFNDLTTLLWFVYSNESRIDSVDGGSRVAPTIEDCVGEIAELIASLLLFRSLASTHDLARRIAAVVLNPTVSAFVDASQDIPEPAPGSVRAVREGDSLPALFAAYTSKLAAFRENPEPDRVLILSNAFGALNLGVIIQRLASDRLQATHLNVQYSQHRANGPDLGARSGTVRALGAASVAHAVDESRARCVIVVDDCIFTGKSFHEIRAAFGAGPVVRALPLMLDTPSLRHYRRGTRDPREAYRTAKEAVLSARELGDRLPAFPAFWDWSAHSDDTPPSGSSEFDEVMSGGDVLLRTLWSRFRDQILASPVTESPQWA